MRTTFATALGRKDVATSVLVRVVAKDGAEGLGEVPTSHSWPDETPAAIAGVLREARGRLRGLDLESYPKVLAGLRRRHENSRMTLSGLEVALFRASLAERQESEWAHWGGQLRQIETDITVPFVPEGDATERWLDHAMRVGFTAYKVKVSGRVEEDLAFLQRIHGRLAGRVERFRLRLDGNQGYTPRSCLRMLEALRRRRIPVEFLEQPLPKDDWAGLRQLRGRAGVALLLDESVASADDCRRAIDERVADGVNIKIAKSGIAESAAILRLARRTGLKLMIGCMTETMAGLSAAILLAAGTGAFDYIDLDSVHFFRLPGAGAGAWGIRLVGPRYVLEDAG